MKRRTKRILIGLAALLLLVPVADALHALFVYRSATCWEGEVERDADGVLAGCAAYELEPAEEADQSTAILFVHGINASPRHYDHLAPALAKRGFACRVMRLPGFAEPLAVYKETKGKAWAAAVLEELDTLRARHERVGVIAHSLGGATTINSLLQRPDAADFAVLLAPAIEVSSSRSPVMTTRFWHEFATSIFLFTDTLGSPYPLDARDPEVTDWPGRTAFTPVVVVDELYGLIDENRPRAADFVTPTLMVLSSDDPVVSTPAAREFFENLGAERKELLMLEKSGHEIQLDWEWPQVAEAIAEFAGEATAPEVTEP